MQERQERLQERREEREMRMLEILLQERRSDREQLKSGINDSPFRADRYLSGDVSSLPVLPPVAGPATSWNIGERSQDESIKSSFYAADDDDDGFSFVTSSDDALPPVVSTNHLLNDMSLLNGESLINGPSTDETSTSSGTTEKLQFKSTVL